MKAIITQIIKDCDICPTLKYDRQPHRPFMQAPHAPTEPSDVVYIDIYTINNTNNLTVIDKFSKFAQAYPLTIRNSMQVIAALSQFFSIFGLPKKLVFDKGAEFSGNLLWLST